MDAEAHSKIEAEVAHASSQIAKLERERDEYKKLVRLLQEEKERLKRGLLGQKTGRLPRKDAQFSLAILDLMLGGEVSRACQSRPPKSRQLRSTLGVSRSARRCPTSDSVHPVPDSDGARTPTPFDVQNLTALTAP